jgi:hypothetical protein
MGKWPTWLRTIWWVLVTGGLSLLMLRRLDNFLNGTNTATDLVVLFLLLALYIAPLFKEIELPGIKLKSELGEVKKELEGIKNQIRLSQEIHSTVAPNFWLNSPPSDSSLPKIEENIKTVIKETLRGYGFSEEAVQVREISVDDKVNYLFAARYNIERELRKLAEPYLGDNERFRHFPIHKVVDLLIGKEVLNAHLGHVIREIYSVCSPAVHGEEVSENQYNFVRDTAPEVLGTLKAITKNSFSVRRTGAL